MNLATWQRQFKTEVLKKESQRQGMEVYIYAIYARIFDSLSDDFSMVKEKLGEVRFKKLIADFLLKNPSKYPCLSQIGERFPSYLKKAGYFESLCDLAQMEWQMCVLAKTEKKPLPPCQPISQLTAEALESARLILNPNMLYDKSMETLIYRKDRRVYFENLDDLSLKFYQLISKGQSLNKIVLLCAKKKVSAKKVTEIFSRWTREHIIIGYEL